jgi:hypothetical protein
MFKLGTPKVQARQLFTMMDIDLNKKVSAHEIVNFIADLDKNPPKKIASIKTKKDK